MATIHVQAQLWHLSGDLHNDDAATLLAHSESLAIPRSNWIIDFAAVEAIDSSAVALMFAWLRRAQAASVSLVMVNVPDNLKKLIQLYGVEDVIKL